MSEESRRPFSELLEELVELYKQLRHDDNFKHPDIEVNGDVDFLLNHFDSIKSSLDNETFEHLGEPVRDLLENLLSELKKEIRPNNENVTNQNPNPEKPQKTELEIIDEKLSKGGLSMDEINILLDRRARLQQN
jgi:hypothetical protein